MIRTRSTSLLLSAALSLAVASLAACAGSTASGPPAEAHGNAVTTLEQGVLTALASRPGVRLAILPIDADGDVALSVGGMLLEDLSARLSNASKLTLVERTQVKKVLNELTLQMTGMISESDVIQFGEMAGAEVLLNVRATRLGDVIGVTARLLDVAEGTSLAGVTANITFDDSLKSAIADRAARMSVRRSAEVLAAFGQMRAGKLSQAEAVFEPLSTGEGERRSVGTMGLAAVAHARGEPDKALELCQTSRDLSDAPSYCWVIVGRVQFERGNADQGREGLVRALADEGTLLDWQKSIAADGLGLMAMADNKIDEALAFYDRAVKLDPMNKAALSNKANILESKGDLATAIKLYQAGVKADPGDRVMALLLRDAEMKLAFAQDEARQTKISTLAAELIANQSKGVAAASRRDDWTSSPLTVSLMPIEEKGAPAKRLGEAAFLEASLRSSLEEVSGVEMVDRQLLSKVLEELQISSSALGDQATALKVGNVMAARILLGGSLVRMGGETQLSLKLIETETTRVIASVNEIFESSARLSKVATAIGGKLQKKVREAFPLRGRVTAKKGKRLQINIGSRMGAAVGEKFSVYEAKSSKLLTTGKIVEVSDGQAWLEVGGGAKKIPNASRVERVL